MIELIKELKLIREQEFASDDTYWRTFNEANGKIVLRDLMSLFYMNQSTIKSESELMYMEGQRSVVEHILNNMIDSQTENKEEGQ